MTRRGSSAAWVRGVAPAQRKTRFWVFSGAGGATGSTTRSVEVTAGPPPAGITLTVEGTNKLTVSGIDKQAVGEAAANIRKIRKPEPYKGKGVRYAGEVVRRKAGKSGK